MSRRRLEEAILRSKALESSGESVDEGSDEEYGRYAELCVRHRIPLTKDSHSIYSLRFSPSGKQLAVGFGNGAIQIVNVESGDLRGTLFSGHRTRQAITSLNYHPINTNILVGAGADGLISYYDIKSELNVLSLTEQENEIHALDFSMDGWVFATAGKDRHIRLYDSQTNEVAFRPGARILAPPLTPPIVSSLLYGGVRSVSMLDAPDLSDRPVCLGGGAALLQRLLNVLMAPDFLIDDELTLTSGHSRRIFALRFHPSEHHIFVTGGWDDSIKVWDKRMAKEARSMISGPHICGPGIDIRNNEILSGSWVSRNALQLWDLRSSSLIQDVPFPAPVLQGEFLYAARFCTDHVVLAGGSGTCSARAVNLKTQEVLGEVSLCGKAVQTVDAAPGGHVVAVGGVGGNLHIAELC